MAFKRVGIAIDVVFEIEAAEEGIALVEEDRALDGELRKLLEEIRAQRWELYVDR